MNTLDYLLAEQLDLGAGTPLEDALCNWWDETYPDEEDEPENGYLILAISPDSLDADDNRALGFPISEGWNFWHVLTTEDIAALVIALADWCIAAIVIDLEEGGWETLHDLVADRRAVTLTQ